MTRGTGAAPPPGCCSCVVRPVLALVLESVLVSGRHRATLRDVTWRHDHGQVVNRYNLAHAKRCEYAPTTQGCEGQPDLRRTRVLGLHPQSIGQATRGRPHRTQRIRRAGRWSQGSRGARAARAHRWAADRAAGWATGRAAGQLAARWTCSLWRRQALHHAEAPASFVHQSQGPEGRRDRRVELQWTCHPRQGG